MNMLMQFFRSRKLLASLFAALVILSSFFFFFRGEQVNESASEDVYKTVQLIRADSLDQVPVVSTTLGTVQSDHEVEVRAETAGRIVSIGIKKGDVIQPDQILLELDHQVLDAQILQAEARLASAQAQLAKLRNGERPEDIAILEQKILAEGERLKEMKRGAPQVELALIETQMENAQKTLDEAKRDFENTEELSARALQTELERSVDIVRNVTSVMSSVLSENLQTIIYPIRFPSNETCELKIFSFAERGIEAKCRDILLVVEQQISLTSSFDGESLSYEIISGYLDRSKQRLIELQSFLSLVLEVVNGTIALDTKGSISSLSEQQLINLKSPIISARASVDQLLSQLTLQIEGLKNQEISNKSSLDSARSAITRAENTLLNLEKEYQIKKAGATAEQIIIQETQIRQLELQLDIAKNGARSEDILAQEAQVKQFQADVAVAVANRDKAIIQSPLRGTVIRLPFEIGDYVNPGEALATISNREALQVKTFITEKEKELVLLNGTVSAEEGRVKGFVEEISPALEQDTKKIEVVIRLTEGIEDLVLGQTLFVSFETSLPEKTLRIPLSAVRIVGDEAFVLTVNMDGMVETMPVTVGTLLEDTVIITGISGDQLIVSDVLGIKEGERVHSSSTL